MPALRAPHNIGRCSRAIPASYRCQRRRGDAIAARVAYKEAPDTLRSTVDDELSSTGIPDALPREFSASVAEEARAEASTSGRAGGLELGGSLRAILLLNLGALLFGSNQVVIKTTEELLSPVALDALRFGAAALCFVPLLPRALSQPRLFLPALELGAWLTGACFGECSAVYNHRSAIRFASALLWLSLAQARTAHQMGLRCVCACYEALPELTQDARTRLGFC